MLTAALLAGTLIGAVVLLFFSYLQLLIEQERTAGEYNRAEAEKVVAGQQRAAAEDHLKLVFAALDEVFVKEAQIRTFALRASPSEKGFSADPQREQAERNFLEKGLRFYEKLSRRTGTSPNAQLEIGRALRRVGVIRAQLRDFKGSKHALDEAIRWLEKPAKQFPEVAEYGLEYANAWHWLYWPLADTGRDQEAEQATRTALALFQKLAVQFPNERNALEGLAWCHHDLARLQGRNGKAADRVRNFDLAEGFYGQLALKFPRETDYRSDAASIRLARGRDLIKVGRRQEAAAAFRDGAALYEYLVADKARTTTHGIPTSTADRTQWRYEVGYACIMQGDLLLQLGHLPEAEAVLSRGLEVHEKLLADFPAIAEYKSRVGWNLWKLGEARKARGQRREAEQTFRAAVDLMEKAGINRWLGDTYGALGELFKEDGRISEAVQARRKAVDAWDKLAAETKHDFRQYQHQNYRALGALLLLLGNDLAKSGQRQEAAAAFRDAAALYEKRIADTPSTTTPGSAMSGTETAWFRHELGYACVMHGDLLQQLGQLSEAEAILTRGLEVHEKLVEEFPEGAGHKLRLAWNQYRLGEVRQALGKRREAEQAYRAAVDILAKGEFSDGMLYLGAPYEALAALYKEEGRIPDALEALRKAVADWEKLAAEFPKGGNETRLLDCRFRLGALLAASGQWREAEQTYSKLVELSPKNPLIYNNLAWLLATCPDSKCRDPRRSVALARKAVDLAGKEGNHWNTLGAAHYCAGDWKAAVEALNKSMELRKGGDSFDWFFLAMARQQLGDATDARRWFNRAVEWMEKNAPMNDDLLRFRAEAEKVLRLKN